MSFFAFDLETTELAPEERGSDRVPPLACAAITLDDRGSGERFYLPEFDPGPRGTDGAMSAEGARHVVHRLEALAAEGLRLLTWNGAGFDLRVLAEASGLHAGCARLALASVDMMFHVLAVKGYRLGLAAALEGMGLQPKSGDGAQAVELWQAGRFADVLDYCAEDARCTLALGVAAEEAGALSWRSGRGNPQRLSLPNGWLTVEECLALPEPDTSWMDSPLRREDAVAWCLTAR